MEWKSSESIKSNVNKINTSKICNAESCLIQKKRAKGKHESRGQRSTGKQTVSAVYLKAETSHRLTQQFIHTSIWSHSSTKEINKKTKQNKLKILFIEVYVGMHYYIQTRNLQTEKRCNNKHTYQVWRHQCRWRWRGMGSI